MKRCVKLAFQTFKGFVGLVNSITLTDLNVTFM